MSGAFLIGRDPDGKDRPVGVDVDGNLKVSIEGAEVVVNAEIDNEVEIKNDVDNPIPIEAAELPLPDGAATETTLSSIDDKLPALVGNAIPVVAGLSIPKHDYIELTYTGDDVTGVAYKVGGTWDGGTDTYTGGTTVGQLELVYSAGKLIKVVEV